MRKERLKLEKSFGWMLLFIPISVFFGFIAHNGTIGFITSVIAIIPLAVIIGYATKEISLQANPTVGGLVSATFGNLIELIIAVLALNRGLIEIVQASIIGSIIGNILLLTGLSLFFGGLKYKHQHFNKAAAGVSSTMLIIAIVGLTMPSLFAFAKASPSTVTALSEFVALVMALIYVAGLWFSLKTHKELFDASDEIRATRQKPSLSIKSASLVLCVATLLVALESEILVRGVESAAVSIGLSHTFIGIVVLAIVTNIAEKSAAVKFALENRISISLEIGLSSAIQIALFVVPILVLISEVFNFGFTLVFSFFEVVAVFMAVMIINYLSADGRCNWLEGAQLISVYFIIAIAFFFL
jgi:Ca2+:H+ antiporter